MAPVACGSPRLPSTSRWRLLGVSMLAASAFIASQCGFALTRTSRRPSLAAARHQQSSEARRLVARRVDPMEIPAEDTFRANKYAKRLEDLFVSGRDLWINLKKNAAKEGTLPKKIYFIGQNGNAGHEVAKAVGESLAYEPAADGSLALQQKPGGPVSEITYYFYQTDKKLVEYAKKTPSDLFMEDEEEYRRIEHQVLKDFDEMEIADYPMICLVGESAVLRPENREIIKKGIVIMLDSDSEYTWLKTQTRARQTGGVFISQDTCSRPPVWAIVNGWDGDPDDTEGKMEYFSILKEIRPHYEELAQIRLRTDVAGVAENSFWGAERIIKGLNDAFSFSKKDEASVDDQMLLKDVEKFLEGARLAKYQEAAMKWCDEQGAASIEDVVENIDAFSEALGLKPLEKKRLEKAAAVVAVA